MTEPSLVIASLRVLGALLFAGSVPSLCLGQIVIDTHVGAWLLSAAFVLSIVLAAAKIYQILRRQPPIDAQFATKVELATVRGETRQEVASLRAHVDDTDTQIFKAIEALRLEFKTDVQELNRADEARASKIHARMDTFASSFSEVKGAVTAELRSLPCNKPGQRCPS